VITGIGAQAQYAKLLLQMGVVSYWPLLRRMPNLRGLLLAVGVGRVSLFVISLAIVVAAAVIGIKQSSEQRFVLAISTSCLATYFLFMHDLSLLALPILLAMDDAAFRMDWRQLGLIAAVPLLFAMFWFATDHFYLGALITSFFLIVKFIGPKTRTAISPVIIGAVH
jgi:hypothetical protein